MKVPDYKVPVPETTIQRFGKKPESTKKTFSSQTSEKLRLNPKTHKIEQNFKIRNEDLSTKKIDQELEIEKKAKQRYFKEVEKEKQLEEEVKKQMEQDKQDERKLKDKGEKTIIFKNKVHEHYSDIQKTQKFQQLRAQSAHQRIKNKDYNKEQQEKTKVFVQKMKKQRQDKQQKQQQQQQIQKSQTMQNNFFFFQRKLPREKLKEQQQQISEKNIQAKQQSDKPDQKIIQKQAGVSQRSNIIFNNTPAPGHHLPENVGQIDKSRKKEIDENRKKLAKCQEKMYSFQKLKHRNLIKYNQFTIKNSDSKNLKLALVEPNLPKKNKKCAFKIINGFSDGIYLGVCLKSSIPDNFEIEKNSLIKKDKLNLQGFSITGDGKLYENGQKGEQTFKIEKNNIITFEYNHQQQNITIQKESTQEQLTINLQNLNKEEKDKKNNNNDKDNNNDNDKQYFLCIISGNQKDQIQYINNLQTYKKQQEELQLKRTKEMKEEREKRLQQIQNIKKKEKKDENNDEDKKWINSDKNAEKTQEKSQKKEENLPKAKQQNEKKQPQIQSFVQYKNGYFPEAKNKKYITHKFSQLERSPMLNKELVKIPGPGSYDPIDPKAIRGREYGNFFKGPLPFLSTCQNVKFGREDRDSGGCNYMDGGNGIFDLEEIQE